MTSLPSSTARLELPVSGKAAPESTITIYVGTQVLGQARANVLGTWSGSIILPDVAGDHTVYAHVAFPDGGSLRSQDYVVRYVPETDEVETLTVTNQVHSTDNTGEHDRDYYTFWPDLPTLEFRMEFVKDASAISRVKVVTTDRMGEEMEIPLRYQAAKDAWVGAQDFTEYNISYHFRVEFLPGGEKQADQSLEGEYTYDAAGNLLTETRDDKTARYTWNKYGHLVGYTDFDGTEYEYGYDVFGLRNRVTVNGATTTYLNNPLGYGMPVASYGAAGEQHYVLSNALAAVRSSGSTYYYHSNLLGSVTEITGSGSAAVNPYTYDQEGSVVSRRESIANPFAYAGIYGLVADGNGLIYDRARYVSAATDSFISKDPAGTRYDSNLYRYLGNDPVNNVDLTGEFAVRFGQLILKMMLASKNTAKSKMIDPADMPLVQAMAGAYYYGKKAGKILNKVVIIPIV